jgi:hypothetical protein
MLAGLWGVVAGSLPPLEQLMKRFMRAPLESRRFADQFFLRQYVWPYARTNLMQHDSVFGFMGAEPFPNHEPRPDGFHVGCAEGNGNFVAKTDLPDGCQVLWRLYRVRKSNDGQSDEELICSYPGTVKNGAVTAHIPTRHARQIEQGGVRVRLFVKSSPGR